jgi:hypothetical protein
MKEYIVTKRVGKLQVGQIVNDSSLFVRRKLQEGDCLEPYKPEKKMDNKTKENKMEKVKYENKEEN